ncbi:glycosyltransferase family 2 protein [Spirulina sp. CS-785/01]|uniref:glycosyltransferase family 2 protein n=1 Tax=Spirulina sp. CS-785/01 TaxID=3021716 RepID=UPI00232E82F0|nr:glycosyltransferase family 2 protein [Spirulina sp. CS-785/01]MDB9311793.1 glycosyltransferase family 2 protein [Spirulina sp. CS-785/01]
MTSKIRLSIALLTRNRPESLNECLESVRSQSVQPFEVVVSDNSDPDLATDTKAVADRWDCRYITGSLRGLCSNRNHAAVACQGTHIRTMDDDHILPPDHLKKCLEAIQSDPHSIWTTGEIGYIEGEFYNQAETANQLSPSGVGIGITNPNDNWGIADGSTIYPRTIYDQGFRMLEDYEYGESSLEFGAYLYANGFRSRCILGVYVEHYAEAATITRRPLSMYESRLYSSICYNLYFQKNYALFLRYLGSYSWRLRQHKNILTYLPQMLNKVYNRWGNI